MDYSQKEMEKEICYNLVWSIQELNRFFDILPELKKTEAFFVSLSCRKKYLTTKERLELSFNGKEMFERRIITKRDFNVFHNTIRKYETNRNYSYVDDKGNPLPSSGLAVYFNINPSNTIKAYNDYIYKMNTLLLELGNCAEKGNNVDSVLNRINRSKSLLMSSYQRSRGTKHFIDIDMDVDKDVCDLPDFINNYLQDFLGDNEDSDKKWYIIETRGGYHVLLPVKYLKDDLTYFVYDASSFYKEALKVRHKENMNNIVLEMRTGGLVNSEEDKATPWEIKINDNAMIPLPGTYAGGFPIFML